MSSLTFATTCPNATVINPAALPTNQALVCGATNDLNSTNVPGTWGSGGFSASYKNGNEALYTFTPTTSGSYNIAYSGQTWTSILVYAGCPTSGGTFTGGFASNASSKNTNVTLTAGIQYFIWFDTWPTPNSPCAGTFTITAPVAPIAGDNCSNAIDLALQMSPISGSTAVAGVNNDFSFCSMGSSRDMIYRILVPNNATLTIGQTVNNFDSIHSLRYGGSCPGTTQIICRDDSDTQVETWTNTTGSDQTVYWIIGGYSTEAGTYTFTWNLSAPPTCLAPTALTNSSLTFTSASHAWTAPSPAPGVGYEWAVTTSATPPASGTATTSTTASSTGLIANTTYFLHVRSNCGSGDFSAWASPVSFLTGYCASTYSSGCNLGGDAITRVVLGTLDNTSGCAASPFYTFFDNVNVPNLTRGTSQTVSITMGGDSTQFSRVWIDFNNNLVFEPSESFSLGTNAGANGTSVITINVPIDAVLGNVRMRIRGADDSAITNTQACGASSSTWGETEDYILNILAVGPTMNASTCNNTFTVVPGESIASNTISGATNYRFKIVDEANAEYFIERANGSMTIHWFAQELAASFKYDHTYQISAQALVNSVWTAYGVSCPFTVTDDPRTKVRADFCGQNLATMDTRIFVDRLPLFSEYIYEVTNTATSQSVTFTRVDPQGTGFRLTQEAASILSAGTTYEVRAKAKFGAWEIPFGTVCTVTTPSIPGTIKLRASSCNVTLTSMLNQAVLSEIANNAVEYQFEVTNTTTSAVTTYTKSNWVLPMADLGAQFTYNTTFSIRVRAKIGTNYNSYGTPCTVTTPNVPTTQLTALYCNQSFDSYRSLYANRVPEAQEYTFEVTNDQSDEVLEVVRSVNHFHLQLNTNSTLLHEGTSFTVRVKAKVNNVYGSYGVACVVTIGAATLLNNDLAHGLIALDKIEAYPNPFTNQFTIKLANLNAATIQVFDINGRLVETKSTNETFEVEMGQNLSSGIYQVRVEQNGKTESFKMIKK